MKTEIVNEKRIKCYDNCGKTIDRYTVVYLDEIECDFKKLYSARGMSSSPFHPQGFGCFTSAQLGNHLGKRVLFSNLPIDCQKLVIQDTN
jgi:hypothetical protein